MAGKGPILTDDLRDERKGDRTYRREATQARRAGKPQTARTLRRIAKDERKHAGILRRTMRKGR